MLIEALMPAEQVIGIEGVESRYVDALHYDLLPSSRERSHHRFGLEALFRHHTTALSMAARLSY